MTGGASVVLGVEYDGSAFHGFQRQRDVRSVQEDLETAISRVADEPVRIVAAGRTDAGVHATQQVVSFVTDARRSPESWRRGVSSLTRDALGVVWAKTLDAPFHARFDALWRHYVYIFSDAPVRPIIHRHLLAWSHAPAARGSGALLDAPRMHHAAQCLVGEHDFSSFRAAACQSKSPCRRIDSISVKRVHGYVAIEVIANAFLLHMVRNVAGALRAVGLGESSLDALRELLRRRDRTLAPPTAPAHGLYLVGVGYPGWRLPPRPPPLLACG